MKLYLDTGTMRLILQPILLIGCFSITCALKPCKVRASNCLASIEQKDVYACPRRGHFRHSTSVFRYYKCPGPGYAACDCACRYRDMCFDPLAAQCAFAFLPEVHNCTPLTTSIPTTSTTSTTTTTRLIEAITPIKRALAVRKPVYDPLQDARTYDLEYRFNQRNRHRPAVVAAAAEASRKRASESHARTYNLAQKDILTAQEALLVERGINPKMVDDVSVFPAWAVAIVVLCVVMLLVLMVIFLY